MNGHRDLTSALSLRTYLGRGCVAVKLENDILLGYFVTGRSKASQARTFEIGLGDSMSVVSLDPQGPTDDLRHYRAIRRVEDWWIVGNGAHVDTVSDRLSAAEGGKPLYAGLGPEPDPPINTPRIWVHVNRRSDGISVGAIRQSVPAGVVRTLEEYSDLKMGEGVLLTTYSGDKDQPVVAPASMHIKTTCVSPEDLVEVIWQNLEADVRVAAVALTSSAGMESAVARKRQ